jgi:hypothetical protein
MTPRQQVIRRYSALQSTPQLSDLQAVSRLPPRRPLFIAAGSTVLGVVAFVFAGLLIQGDHLVEQCDVLGVGCGRVQAYYGLAAAGWALLLVGILALAVAGVRRLRTRRGA